nr:hypothetical protein [uncultured bacterium]
MHTHTLPSHHRARRAARTRAARAGLAAGLGLAGLALVTACDDAAQPVGPAPTAARSAAAAQPTAGAAATTSLIAKGFARILANTDSVIAGAQTYNAAGGRVENEYEGPRLRTLTFNTLRSVLRGEPHAQVALVRQYSQTRGDGRCTGHAAVAENGADILVHAYCAAVGADPMLLAAQVFDRDAPAAYATVDALGSARNTHHLARSERVAEGRYRVFFERAPVFGVGAKPIAFVTSRSSVRDSKGQSHAAACKLRSVGSNAQRVGELGVEVDCFGIGDRPADASFNVIALAQQPRTAYALVGDGQRLFAENSDNPGGQTTVVRLGTGTYRVAFQGVAASWSDHGTAMVTAHGPGGGTCALDNWVKIGTGARVDVQCRSAEGDLADQRFAVLATTRR